MSPTRRRLLQQSARFWRGIRDNDPTVHYFHQVDDPYSHLAIQTLERLLERYQVGFQYHLVSRADDAYLGDAKRYPIWSLHDAEDIASYYGLDFPHDAERPSADQIMRANRRLADQCASSRFPEVALDVGQQLWGGQTIDTYHLASEEDAEIVLENENKIRGRWGHYLGAMFYFEGEWYWGVDRLCRLETRLIEEGFSNEHDAELCVPRPQQVDATPVDASHVLLEYYPSLRSPYTAISFRRTMQLVKRTGVQLELKPVLPMMMRGVPAPRAKAIYILNDTRREAEAEGEPFGKMVDPFGEPVRLAFSLYPWARDAGKGAAYLQSYLDAAFADGIDISSEAGLRQVVERLDLPWDEAKAHLGNDDWQAELESNVQAMNRAGLWGVPSYRVSGGNKPHGFSCWGQDRLWRVESEIAARASADLGEE